MKMSAADQLSYPKLKIYVKDRLPEVLKVPLIVKALNDIGQLDMKRLKLVLTWGNEPTVKVATLVGAYGEFTPDSKSNEIRISKKMVEEFEAGKGLRTTATGGKVSLVGVTILHELTHWADDQDGTDRPGEEGEEFERKVYGKVIT